MLSGYLASSFLRFGDSEPQQEWHMIKVQFGTPYDKKFMCGDYCWEGGQLNSSLGLEG